MSSDDELSNANVNVSPDRNANLLLLRGGFEPGFTSDSGTLIHRTDYCIWAKSGATDTTKRLRYCLW